MQVLETILRTDFQLNSNMRTLCKFPTPSKNPVLLEKGGFIVVCTFRGHSVYEAFTNVVGTHHTTQPIQELLGNRLNLPKVLKFQISFVRIASFVI